MPRREPEDLEAAIAGRFPLTIMVRDCPRPGESQTLMAMGQPVCCKSWLEGFDAPLVTTGVCLTVEQALKLADKLNAILMPAAIGADDMPAEPE